MTLTEGQISGIIEDRIKGHSIRDTAKRNDVSEWTVKQICRELKEESSRVNDASETSDLLSGLRELYNKISKEGIEANEILEATRRYEWLEGEGLIRDGSTTQLLVELREFAEKEKLSVKGTINACVETWKLKEKGVDIWNLTDEAERLSKKVRDLGEKEKKGDRLEKRGRELTSFFDNARLLGFELEGDNWLWKIKGTTRGMGKLFKILDLTLSRMREKGIPEDKIEEEFSELIEKSLDLNEAKEKTTAELADLSAQAGELARKIKEEEEILPFLDRIEGRSEVERLRNYERVLPILFEQAQKLEERSEESKREAEEAIKGADRIIEGAKARIEAILKAEGRHKKLIEEQKGELVEIAKEIKERGKELKGIEGAIETWKAFILGKDLGGGRIFKTIKELLDIREGRAPILEPFEDWKVEEIRESIFNFLRSQCGSKLVEIDEYEKIRKEKERAEFKLGAFKQFCIDRNYCTEDQRAFVKSFLKEVGMMKNITEGMKIFLKAAGLDPERLKDKEKDQ